MPDLELTRKHRKEIETLFTRNTSFFFLPVNLVCAIIERSHYKIRKQGLTLPAAHESIPATSQPQARRRW